MQQCCENTNPGGQRYCLSAGTCRHRGQGGNRDLCGWGNNRAGNPRSDRYQYLINRSRLTTIHRQGLKNCLVSGGFDPENKRIGGSFKTLLGSANELTVNIYSSLPKGMC